MNEILDTIFARIKQVAPEIQFLDINLGQLMLETPPVAFPCALVDIASVDYTQVKSDTQKAQATITVQFGFSVLGPSDYNSTPELSQQATAHYSIIEKVALGLHSYGCEYFSPLIRRNLTRDSNTYPRTFKLTFSTTWLQ